MDQTDANARLLRPADAESVRAALDEALQGGRAVAPLPDDPEERRRTLEMLALDTPVSETDAAAVVTTSGSTGRPKGVVLSRAAITASVAATCQRLGGPGDWVLALPPHYVAGLMVVARAVLAGTEVRTVASDLHDLPRIPRSGSRRRYVSLVPTQLVRALADPALTEELAGFDAVLLGGAAADPRLLSRARDAGVRVVTTYGMSETCGGVVYDGTPLDGVQVDIAPDSGRVLLGGPTLFSGYRLRPDLTREAFSGARLLTSDRGRWHESRLVVEGRVDDVVVSGGVNVDLAAVERAARGWPSRQGEIVLVGLPDHEWGTQVVAVTDGPGSESELRAYLRQSLPAASVPRRLTRVNALPRTSSGKIDRQRLIAELTTELEKTT